MSNLSDITKEEIKSLDDIVRKHTFILNDIISDITEDSTRGIDDLIHRIKGKLRNIAIVPTEILEECVLELSIEVYYTSQILEEMGLRYDVSKALYKEVFDAHYNDIDGTINDKTAYSQSKSIKQDIEKSINERAYKKIKNKIDIATELIAVIKKVISRRISEFELSRVKISEGVVSSDTNRVRNKINKKNGKEGGADEEWTSRGF